MDKQREFTFTQDNFDAIRMAVRKFTGINLTDAKRELVYSRLSRRLRVLGIDNFGSYIKRLEDEKSGELTEFINSITTNLTSFFREYHHFEYLTKTVFPTIRRARGGNKRLRIWSAGCSTGEEPYSIAITLKESIPDIDRWDAKIIATDLDSSVLASAAQGEYRADRIEGLSEDIKRRWFQKGKGKNEGMVRVHPGLQEIISFEQLNLVHPWPKKETFDIIFCRNVVIYFDKETQRDLFHRFADVMGPDGHLFIGHSESLHRVSDRFRLLGKTIYSKVA